MAITGAAMIFDYLHEKSHGDGQEQTGNSEPEESREMMAYWINPAISVSPKIPPARPTLKKIFYETNNRFILLHHSMKALFSVKTEPDTGHRSLWILQHSIILRHPLSAGNDDDIPC